eukprot:TRINITY_DN23594_c0_g1_i1.p1 TRINITY_DN23594_c0_g1~~TRINITY_DN23594_c0_g1_i1.p1  ORF type:complete len:242 (+),score=56.74 TRINITY_DN23594_c0_g1_i1:218-943(+)
MGETASKPCDAVSAALHEELGSAPEKLSQEDMEDIAHRCCLRLHLPFDPEEDAPKLGACGSASNEQLLTRSSAHDQLAAFLTERSQSNQPSAPPEADPSNALPSEELVEVVANARRVLGDFEEIEAHVRRYVHEPGEESCMSVERQMAYGIADLTTFYMAVCTELRLTEFYSPAIDARALHQAQVTMSGNHVVTFEHAVSCVAAALRVKVEFAETMGFIPLASDARFILGIEKAANNLAKN